MAIRPGGISALSGNRLLAMVGTQIAPLAECAPFASNRSDSQPLVVVARSSRPAHGRIRFGGQTGFRQALGVGVSIPGRTNWMGAERRPLNAGSQGAISRGVGYLGAFLAQRRLQYVLGRRAPVSWPI